jgi:hypothetical protein
MLKVREFDGKNLILINNKRGGKEMTMFFLFEQQKVFLTIKERNGTTKISNGSINTKDFYDFFDGSLSNLWEALSKHNNLLFEKSWLFEYKRSGDQTLSHFRDYLDRKDFLKLIMCDAMQCLSFDIFSKYSCRVYSSYLNILTLSMGQKLASTYKILNDEGFIDSKENYLSIFNTMLSLYEQKLITEEELGYFCDKLIELARRMNPIKNTMADFSIDYYQFKTLINRVKALPYCEQIQTIDIIDYLTSENMESFYYKQKIDQYIKYIGSVMNSILLSLKLTVFPENLEESISFEISISKFFYGHLYLNIDTMINKFMKISGYDTLAKTISKLKYKDKIFQTQVSVSFDSAEEYHVLLPKTPGTFTLINDKFFEKETFIDYMKKTIENKSFTIGILNLENVFVGRVFLTFDEDYKKMYIASYESIKDEDNEYVKGFVDNLATRI